MINFCKNYHRILTHDQDPDIDAIHLSYWKISPVLLALLCVHKCIQFYAMLSRVDFHTYHHSQDTEQFFQIKSSSFLPFEKCTHLFPTLPLHPKALDIIFLFSKSHFI